MNKGTDWTDELPFRIILTELPHSDADCHHFRANLKIVYNSEAFKGHVGASCSLISYSEFVSGCLPDL